MKRYKMGLTFESREECTAWEDRNFQGRMYRGDAIMMVTHTENDGKVTIDEIIVV